MIKSKNLESLPREIICYIFSFVVEIDPKAICRVERVCKTFNVILNENFKSIMQMEAKSYYPHKIQLEKASDIKVLIYFNLLRKIVRKKKQYLYSLPLLNTVGHICNTSESLQKKMHTLSEVKVHTPHLQTLRKAYQATTNWSFFPFTLIKHSIKKARIKKERFLQIKLKLYCDLFFASKYNHVQKTASPSAIKKFFKNIIEVEGFNICEEDKHQLNTEFIYLFLERAKNADDELGLVRDLFLKSALKKITQKTKNKDEPLPPDVFEIFFTIIKENLSLSIYLCDTFINCDYLRDLTALNTQNKFKLTVFDYLIHASYDPQQSSLFRLTFIDTALKIANRFPFLFKDKEGSNNAWAALKNLIDDRNTRFVCEFAIKLMATLQPELKENIITCLKDKIESNTLNAEHKHKASNLIQFLSSSTA